MSDESRQEPSAEQPPATEPESDQSTENPEEEPEPITADSLRVERNVGEEMFGDLFTRIATYGSAQLGSHNVTNNYLGEQPLDPVLEPLRRIDELMKIYVPADADARLGELLHEQSTACLVGPKNSGRLSTACAALANRHPGGDVYEIELPSTVSPEDLNRRKVELTENSGYLLRLQGAGHTDLLRVLGPRFRRASCSILLIRDEDPRRLMLGDAEVRHQPPDPVAVFGKHLAARLSAEASVDDYLTVEVKQALNAAYGPKESVALANAIAQKLPAGEEAIGEILGRSQPKRRERAKEILLPEQDATRAKHRRTSQHERAFRISYAVFYQRPMRYVFEAAELLLREIDSAAMRPDWGKMALQHPVGELLGTELGRDWAAQRDAATGTSRTAWIRDPGLRGAIIDVAWHDFDGTRNSMLNWLDRLVASDDKVMRRAAAETAGLLVYYDFDEVHRLLVDGWAKSRKANVRQAAAWTMTLTDMADDMGPRIRAKLREWCSSAALQGDTGARVYASGLEQPVLAWSMNDLAHVARERMQARGHSVAEAVNQLYRPERADWLLKELSNWSAVPALRVHAARSVLALAARIEPGSPNARPDLLARLAGRQLDTGQLARPWRIAFVDPAMAPAAGRVLGRWIRYADTNIGFRADVADLLDAIGSSPSMRRRIDFYLKRSADLDNGVPDWARVERAGES